MLTFTVHEPPNPSADRVDRAESLVFVKDGFSWAAAVFAPLWLLAHRLWLPLLAFVAAAGALTLVQQLTGLNEDWVALAVLAVNILVGLEADTLRRWGLQRRGWRELGAVSGRTVAECERRFFEAWLPSQPIITPQTAGGAADRRKWPVIGSLLGARS